jgi:hypothetical protein
MEFHSIHPENSIEYHLDMVAHNWGGKNPTKDWVKKIDNRTYKNGKKLTVDMSHWKWCPRELRRFDFFFKVEYYKLLESFEKGKYKIWLMNLINSEFDRNRSIYSISGKIKKIINKEKPTEVFEPPFALAEPLPPPPASALGDLDATGEIPEPEDGDEEDGDEEDEEDEDDENEDEDDEDVIFCSHCGMQMVVNSAEHDHCIFKDDGECFCEDCHQFCVDSDEDNETEPNANA